MVRISALASCIVLTNGHGSNFVVNKALGVPGFPNCRRQQPDKQLSVEDAAADLVCEQRAAFEDSIKVACVGDSITAGYHATDGSHSYPSQLQALLDSKHGVGKFEVTNLGACGSTMQKNADSPYWQRPQYPALTGAKWDTVIIMLGTNDAKDAGSHGPDNWKHDCGGDDLSACTFANDYSSFVDVVRGLGTSDVGPTIFTMIPPPLMQQSSYGMNQTVINSVFPRIVRDITTATGVQGYIDLWAAFGGLADWQSRFPEECTQDGEQQWSACTLYCNDAQCDQCHPGDVGYAYMASWISDQVFGGIEVSSSVSV